MPRTRTIATIASLAALAGGGTGAGLVLTEGSPAPKGCMGPCRPALHVGLPPRSGAFHARVPDVSEWQPCVSATIPTVARIAYGTREDSRWRCNAARLRGHWLAGYTYLVPGSCSAQGAATASYVRSVGGIRGPIIADAEEPLPAGFVRCFLSTIHRDLPGQPTLTYTGCYSGLEIVGAWWVPDYGVAYPCTRGGHPFVAWQYSDGTYCGEAFVTDCSFDFGVLRFTRKVPCTPCKERAQLRRAIAAQEGALRSAQARASATVAAIRSLIASLAATPVSARSYEGSLGRLATLLGRHSAALRAKASAASTLAQLRKRLARLERKR
jgi:hypothetical protein